MKWLSKFIYFHLCSALSAVLSFINNVAENSLSNWLTSFSHAFAEKDYLLFSTVTWAGDAPIDLGDDRLGTSIRHLPLDQFVTCPEFLLDVLELDTFYDNNCRADSDDFNASKIIRKYEGLTRQLRWGILTILAARSPSCHHLPPPESISARWLSHILWEA